MKLKERIVTATLGFLAAFFLLLVLDLNLILPHPHDQHHQLRGSPQDVVHGRVKR